MSERILGPHILGPQNTKESPPPYPGPSRAPQAGDIVELFHDSHGQGWGTCHRVTKQVDADNFQCDWGAGAYYRTFESEGRQWRWPRSKDGRRLPQCGEQIEFRNRDGHWELQLVTVVRADGLGFHTKFVMNNHIDDEDWRWSEASASQTTVVKRDDLGVDFILSGYVDAIGRVLASGDRRRFVTAEKMCQQANRLLELVAVRAGDFNALARTDDYDIDTDGGGIINGALMPRGGFGQDGDAIRQIIATLTATVQPTVAKNQADTHAAKATELESLLRARKLMTKAEAADLTVRIDTLRKEIASVKETP